MFLSLVRPDRISSPMTSSAAVTISWLMVSFRAKVDALASRTCVESQGFGPEGRDAADLRAAAAAAAQIIGRGAIYPPIWTRPRFGAKLAPRTMNNRR